MATLDRQVQETFALFQERYRPFAETLPLALGMLAHLVERHPEIGERLVRITLTRYCARPRYLRALSRGGPRYDLEGNPAGEVTDEQRQKALARFLADRARRQAETQRRWELRRQQREAARAKAERLKKAEQAKQKKDQQAQAQAPVPPKPPRKPAAVRPAVQATPSEPAPKLGRPVLSLKKKPTEGAAA